MIREYLRRHLILRRSLAKNYGEINYYSDPTRRKSIFEKIIKIRDVDLLMSPSEAYQMYTIVESVSKIPGDIAEVGVYKGRSARLILEASGYQKHIHLFDTFSGLPSPCERDLKEHYFEGGEYYGSRKEVEEYLDDVKKYTTFYEGVFPETSDPIKNKKFSFVNIDVDLYQGTYDALTFFYPRMERGGVIISHDYIMDGGVRDAIISFFEDKPESVIEVGAGSQGFIVKL